MQEKDRQTTLQSVIIKHLPVENIVAVSFDTEITINGVLQKAKNQYLDNNIVEKITCKILIINKILLLRSPDGKGVTSNCDL